MNTLENKIKKRKNMTKKYQISYDEIESLNDEDEILISTSFLYFTIAYYQLFDKKFHEEITLVHKILEFIKPQKNYFPDPRYAKITVGEIKKIYQNFPKNRFQNSSFRKIIKTKLTSDIAYKLLFDRIINEPIDFFKPENKWLIHSLYVGIASERIALKLGLDQELAKSLGFIHDIGRKFDHSSHLIEGYKFMLSKGFLDEARICLTHSFIDNDITLTAGGGPKNPYKYQYINSFLENNCPTIYDNIIQLCDLFCLETGFTTIEKRILDITNRKGIFDKSYLHFQKAIELKERIEEMMGCNLYDLFPEIKQEDLDNIQIDYEKLIKLLKPKKLIKEN